ncbi:bifunctional enoyl-CoA hydratase/phosphate acetyltransferase [candidate division KSB1 bacterium]|nr:bifunctional enoyl-CoA hydratase/phosphate acetyltransferase [candidate division KSB1 bacterium]
MKTQSFDQILKRVKGELNKTIAVAMAEEEEVLAAVSMAYRERLADAVLVGDEKTIRNISAEHDIDISAFDIVQADSEQQAVVRAVQLVRGHLADVLMKGKCSTATLLKAVLDKQHGLRSGNLLCHLAAFQVDAYHKLLFMSDAAMNIRPDLLTKVSIVENTIRATQALGMEKPKIALLAAIEKVNPGAMVCTEDAAVICKMQERGQIKGAIIDGPLAMDNAISHKSCEVKGIATTVGGDADILIMPDIESANIFYKTMAYLGCAKTAGIIIGAKVPIILTSRADSDETKFYSLALGMATSQRR